MRFSAPIARQNKPDFMEGELKDSTMKALNW
jgi:hypothetical protein